MKRSSSKKRKSSRVKRKNSRVKRKNSRKTKKRTMKGGNIQRFKINIIHNNTLINLNQNHNIDVDSDIENTQVYTERYYESLNSEKTKKLKTIIEQFLIKYFSTRNKEFNINNIIVDKTTHIIDVYVSSTNLPTE
jgi:hypothetical protein